VIYSAFQHRRLAALESLRLLRERQRSNSQGKIETLTQALFERPVLEDEIRIAAAIRQPLSTVRMFLAKNRIYNRRFEQRRNTVEREVLVRRYCEGFTLSQHDDYLSLIRSDARSRIIVSFHIGDFLFGSACLLGLENSARRHYVLTLNKASKACYSNLAAGFGAAAPGPECELLFEATTSVQLSQILRTPNNSLLLFCDVPGGLNQTTEVEFLNRSAWFSAGPAVLAITNSVPLLPLINYSTDDRAYLRFGAQIEPKLLPSETLQQAVKRITQTLVSFFESVLQKHPDQWRFLALLPLYFVDPETQSFD
jgi:Bacterial lipid A biosynthesis acyltransferase